MFETVENRNITDIVIQQIQDMIMSGELKAGDKLPSERNLIQMLNISRPALREALKQLEVLGLIKSRQGQGTFIVNNVCKSFFKPLSLSFKLDNGNPKDILDLRLLLETYCAVHAARNATDEEIAKYETLHHKIAASTSLDEASALNREMHSLLIQNSGNDLIVLIYKNISYLFDNFITQSVYFASSKSDVIAEISEEHEALLQAIKMHDEKKAEEVIKDHINKICLEPFQK